MARNRDGGEGVAPAATEHGQAEQPRTYSALVLDTSLFVNPDTQHELGEKLEEAVERFLSLASRSGIELYMPLSIYRELSHFAEEATMERIHSAAVVRGPDLYNLQIPAALLHLFIGELRQRVNKGLRIAESAIRSDNTEANLKRIRQQYREALRTGIVDSVEDFDVVLLAKEVGGAILSVDDGIAQMGETLGIEVLSAKGFLNRYGDGAKRNDRERNKSESTESS